MLHYYRTFPFVNILERNCTQRTVSLSKRTSNRTYFKIVNDYLECFDATLIEQIFTNFTKSLCIHNRIGNIQTDILLKKTKTEHKISVEKRN